MKISMSFIESGPTGSETEKHICNVSEILNPRQAIEWATREINKYVTEDIEQTTLEPQTPKKKPAWKGRGARKKIERQDDGRPIGDQVEEQAEEE